MYTQHDIKTSRLFFVEDVVEEKAMAGKLEDLIFSLVCR